MDIFTLISTCNRRNIDELTLERKNIFKNTIIVNQDVQNKLDSRVENKSNNIKMLTLKEKGLAKSRNRLLQNVDHGIGIITDDDIVFSPDYENKVNKIYEANPDADVIIFNLMIGNKKIGSDKERIHNKISIMSVMSCQITFRIDSIKNKNIKFDERFGLGAQFGSGEENIFLSECLKKGLKIKHIPYILCYHPDIPTTGERWTKDLIISKGAFSKIIYRRFSFLIELYFLFFKRKFYKNEFSMIQFIKLFNQGKKQV